MKPFWLLATFRVNSFIGIGVVLIPGTGGFYWIRMPRITVATEARGIRDSWHMTTLVTICPMPCLFRWAGGAFESFVRIKRFSFRYYATNRLPFGHSPSEFQLL